MLRSDDRRRQMAPEQLLAEHVKPGAAVLEIGAGTGFWTETLAQIVGEEGHIYAVDVEPIMLDELRTLVEERDLKNVTVVPSQDVTIPLPDRSADIAFLGFVLHELAEPIVFLREVVRLLKPHGRVLVVDWQKRPTVQGPPIGERLSREEAQALLGAVGLTVHDAPAPHDDVYVLTGEEFRPNDPEMTTPTV